MKEEMIELLKTHGVPEIEENVYQECTTFIFLVSWFEELLFNNDTDKRQCPENIKKICKDLNERVDINLFSFFGEHYSKRYIKNGRDGQRRFRQLRLGEYRGVVQPALCEFSKGNKSNELLFSYLMIVYRFRNNTFHGAKKLICLNEYEKEFEINNRFMIALINQILSLQYKGFNNPESNL